MGKLFRAVGVIAPVMVVLLIYVWYQHAQIDAEMDLERAKFDRSWAEFDMDFIDDSDEGRTKALARAMKRAEDAEAEIQRLTQERDEQREKLDQLLQQLEGTLQDENFDHPVLDELEARMMEGSGR